jgi:hypothetical protein
LGCGRILYFAAGLPFLMLWRAKFFLFGHSGNYSVLNQCSGVSSVAADRAERNLHFFQKKRFSRLTVFF